MGDSRRIAFDKLGSVVDIEYVIGQIYKIFLVKWYLFSCNLSGTLWLDKDVRGICHIFVNIFSKTFHDYVS